MVGFGLGDSRVRKRKWDRENERDVEQSKQRLACRLFSPAVKPSVSAHKCT